VTSQSQWIAVTKVYEPRDLDYLSKLLTPDALSALGELPQFGAILWEQSKRAGYLLDRDRKVIRLLGAPRAPALPARRRAL